MRTIIGLGGKAHHGKSTVADMITKADPSFTRLSFAGALKDMIKEVHEKAPE